MAEQSGQDKTEQPTARRREQAKDKGNVAKSQELNSVAVLIAGMLAFKAVSGLFSDTITRFIILTYQESSFTDITIQSFHGQAMNFMKVFAMLTAPVILTLLVFGLAVNYAQVGFMFAKKALIPDFKKINPLSGLKRMFAVRSLVELFKGLFKITILIIICYSVLKKHEEAYLLLANRSVSGILGFVTSIIFEMTLKVCIALLIMAAADYAYQRWEHEKNLKMSKQEVKDENKQEQGDPQVKGRIRAAQMQAARNRMMQAIPEATVVVTNPTFIAIAIKYDPKSNLDAPKVVAKGKLKVAEKIKKIAEENMIPIIENKPLARGLFEVCEIGSEIPMAFYQAIAEILSRVYNDDKSKLPSLGGLNA